VNPTTPSNMLLALAPVAFVLTVSVKFFDKKMTVFPNICKLPLNVVFANVIIKEFEFKFTIRQVILALPAPACGGAYAEPFAFVVKVFAVVLIATSLALNTIV